ncbi:MAG: hypothetical protein DVB22_002692 [Verrucomicrobia bacterium]|nr:MAG: hypothetical protein DVB22_002692 [Verrucomicrobiota bacterium]
MTSSGYKIAQRVLLYGFFGMVIWSLAHAYVMIRNERVNTRLSLRMPDGEHEVVVALPAGRYLIHFTASPNVSVQIQRGEERGLSAAITTKLVRADGGLIVKPTTVEAVSFLIEGDDVFKPVRILVSIPKAQESTVYMNLGQVF